MAALHVVLVSPRIPPNTGNVARLCACTGARLHLVHPLGFSLDDRHLRRAGLDYWPYLRVEEHENWAQASSRLPRVSRYAFTTKAERSLWDIRFRPDDVLIFGPETEGLPPEILGEKEPPITPVRIPMRADAPVRSLNLSSAVAVAVYEALRQLNHARLM